MRAGRRVAWTMAGGAGAAAAGYASYALLSWFEYGKSRRTSPLREYIAEPAVSELHRATIHAPAERVWDAAMELDLMRSPISRILFEARARLMGASSGVEPPRVPFREQALKIGWGVLREVPGQEIVFGSVCRPWDADVVFRAIPAEEFQAFDDAGFAKIVWNIRVEPNGNDAATLTTETLAAATDPKSKRRFRRYWALASPGIRLIRREMLRLVRAAAEKPAVAADAAPA